MTNPFSALWTALTNLVSSVNRLASAFDGMSEQIETRSALPKPETNGTPRVTRVAK